MVLRRNLVHKLTCNLHKQSKSCNVHFCRHFVEFAQLELFSIPRKNAENNNKNQNMDMVQQINLLGLFGLASPTQNAPSVCPTPTLVIGLKLQTSIFERVT